MEPSRDILSEVEGCLYLSPAEYTNMSFISDICFGDKKAMPADDVRVCTVSHIAGLRTKDLIQFLIEECDAEDYLPDNYTDRKPYRNWIANLCNSLQHDRLSQLIKDVLEKKEDKMLEKKNLVIEIKPEIASIFNNSRMVAVAPGKSHQLLRKNILRKNRERKEDEEKLKDERLSSVMELHHEIDDLRNELVNKDGEIESLRADRAILSELFDKGVIDAHGNVLE